jgi:long-chain acyl-CoA synthetase
MQGEETRSMIDTLGEIMPRAARLFGDKTALVMGDRSWSFRDLEAETNRFANALARLGIKAGDRVSLYSQNAVEWIVTYYATLKCGAVINPVNVMLTPEEVCFVTNDCGARIIVASADKGEALVDVKERTPLEHIVLPRARHSNRCRANPRTCPPSAIRPARRAIPRGRCWPTGRS